VTRLIAAFPDVAFVVERISVDGDQVTVQWRMQATNTGPFKGIPEPTGRKCDRSGVDLIAVGSEGITCVVVYFDQKTLVEQLGFQAVIVRQDEEPLHFGRSMRTDFGNTTVPGALTMTWIDVDSDEEAGDVGLRVDSSFTSFWVPHRLNDQFRNCTGCGRMVRISTGAASGCCACGGEVAVTSYI
jgi:hypothetical protein